MINNKLKKHEKVESRKKVMNEYKSKLCILVLLIDASSISISP
jgi:hypothetical protein